MDPTAAADDEEQQQQPPSASVHYCEACEKDFPSASQYEAHVESHEACLHPGCGFRGSKQVVVGHFNVAHGKYRGSGFRVLKVEGRSFRILVGDAPEDVAQWREERRLNFPTAANVARRLEQRQLRRDQQRGGFGGGGRGAGSGVKPAQPPGAAPLGAEGKEEEGEGPAASLLLPPGEGEGEGEEGRGGGGGGGPVDRESVLYGVCRAYLRNQCPNTPHRCRYRHGPAPAGGASNNRGRGGAGRGGAGGGRGGHAHTPTYCRFYTKPGGSCLHGDSCQFVHDPELKAALEAWVQDRRASNAAARAEGEGEAAAAAAGGASPRQPHQHQHQQHQHQQAPRPRGGQQQQGQGQGQRREPTLLKRLLGMEVERETKLVLACVRFLVQTEFLQKKQAPVEKRAKIEEVVAAAEREEAELLMEQEEKGEE